MDEFMKVAVDSYLEWVVAGNGTDEDATLVDRHRSAMADLKATFEWSEGFLHG